MWVSQLNIRNIRSIEKADISFSRGINILIGPNNAGKSTILLPILSLQNGLPRLENDAVRRTTKEAQAEIFFDDPRPGIPNHVLFKSTGSGFTLEYQKKQHDIFGSGCLFNSVEPEHFIFPFLTKRKNCTFDENISGDAVFTVSKNLKNLYAKVDHLANLGHEYSIEFHKACKEILGFNVTAVATQGSNGKKAGYIFNNTETIPLSDMGEGTTNIIGLLCSLFVANNNLILIEEPENDLHPLALKKLLNLITEKSQNNQFIITTHSHIVVSNLGCVKDSKIFYVSNSINNKKIPTSSIDPAEDTIESRLQILSDLGYEISDICLSKAWIFFEEASAEKIFKCLMKLFYPEMVTHVTTFSSRCVSEVEPKFSNFNNQFVFAHKEPVYKNKAWVIIDAGDAEKAIVDRLKKTYVNEQGWTEEHFIQLTKHEFEKYYPPFFKEEVDALDTITNKQQKFKAKKELREKVEKWIIEKETEAKSAFEISAKEILEILKQIRKSIIPS